VPAVLALNRGAITKKLATVSRLLGVRADDEETLACECAGAVRALRQQVGLPDGLREAGIPDDGLPHLAELAFADPCHFENPRPCTQEDLFQLYKASW